MKSTSTAVVVCLMLSAGQAALAGTNDILALPHLELLPSADPLPHLICSPPSIIGGGGEGVDQHDDTRRAGGAALGGDLRSRGAADGLAAPLF